MSQGKIASRNEASLRVGCATLESGVRDFRIFRVEPGQPVVEIIPLELLALDRAAAVVGRVTRADPELGMNLALARLLVPAMSFARQGRHVAVEPWTEEELQRTQPLVRSPSPLAKDLAAEQQREYVELTSSPFLSRARTDDAAWDAFFDLPQPEEEFDDPVLGRLAKALYVELTPEGEGPVTLECPEIVRRVNDLYASDFAPLGLGFPRRTAQKKFKLLLAVAIRFVSQLCGSVAEELVHEFLARQQLEDLTNQERHLLESRHGADPAVSGINVGFLQGSGEPVARAFAAHQTALAGLVHADDVEAVEDHLQVTLLLVGRRRSKRKAARAAERKSRRDSHADRMPQGLRLSSEYAADDQALAPATVVEREERIAALHALFDEIRSEMKDRDARVVEAILAADGDRKLAAQKLGTTHKSLSRRYRQTVMPAMKRIVRQLGLELATDCAEA